MWQINRLGVSSPLRVRPWCYASKNTVIIYIFNTNAYCTPLPLRFFEWKASPFQEKTLFGMAHNSIMKLIIFVPLFPPIHSVLLILPLHSETIHLWINAKQIELQTHSKFHFHLVVHFNRIPNFVRIFVLFLK